MRVPAVTANEQTLREENAMMHLLENASKMLELLMFERHGLNCVSSNKKN